jgi:hypothetical protein
VGKTSEERKVPIRWSHADQLADPVYHLVSGGNTPDCEFRKKKCDAQ